MVVISIVKTAEEHPDKVQGHDLPRTLSGWVPLLARIVSLARS